MRSTPVLIVGAGPTGLVLALGLARKGIEFDIIDNDPGPGPHSRAVVVHARTLEFYRQFGIADEVIAEGVRVETGRLRQSKQGRIDDVLSFRFGDLGAGISKYPFALAYPQDLHEKLLVRVLEQMNVRIRWNTTLTGYTVHDDRVEAVLSGPGGSMENIEAGYICGCDGAHSVVRDSMHVGFAGGTYPNTYFVADVELKSGFEKELIVTLGQDTFTLLLPVRKTGMQRLIGLIPPDSTFSASSSFEDLRAGQETLIGKKIEAVNWFSTYRVHHRVADHFTQGRAFLLGDAGHLHSPAGGQGMNTGIGDAVNLGWKLAMVIAGDASPKLLDTYEAERIGFARTLVATTDRAFNALIAGGVAGEIVRRTLMPLFFGLGTSTEAGRHAMFRLLSQTQIQYERSGVSEGKMGHIHGGDRLPWFVFGDTDNYAPLSSCNWQLHVFETPPDDVQTLADSRSLPLHVFAWDTNAASAHFKQDGMYLVRPDGYVAWAGSVDDAVSLRRYLDQQQFATLT